MRRFLETVRHDSRAKHFVRAGLLALVPITTVLAVPQFPNPAIFGTFVVAQIVLVFWLSKTTYSDPKTHHDVPHAKSVDRTAVEARLRAVSFGAHHDRKWAALVVRIDDRDRLSKSHAPAIITALEAEIDERLGHALREHDVYCRLSTMEYAIALLPQVGLDLGRVLAVAQRIQSRLGEVVQTDAGAIWLSASVGFCTSARAAQIKGVSMLDAALEAANKAELRGPSGLSSYSVLDHPANLSSNRLRDLERALESGEICAFFQPQIETSTGRVSGLEALARWVDPKQGPIPPNQFLPQIEAAGLSAKLTERILNDALDCLVRLDSAGFIVPSVAINLAPDDLLDATLADRILWALDRRALAPERLTVEILETVVANTDSDVAVRTIARLAGLGCGIDLDDFGTGHASITNIRRFAINRLKIDRSFVTGLHTEHSQRKIVSAIVSMAQQLDLQTVAEGVETAEEQVLLAQLGCTHLQGFAIARPMPAQHVEPWLKLQNEALERGEPYCDAFHEPKHAAPRTA